MILGVSGLNGAGKGEVVRFLEARSFYALSLSDVIRDDLREQGSGGDARAHDRDRPRDPRGARPRRPRRASGAPPAARSKLRDRFRAASRGGRGAARAHGPLPADLGGRRRERAPRADPRARPRRRSDEPRGAARIRSTRARQRRSRRPAAARRAAARRRHAAQRRRASRAARSPPARPRAQLFFERPSWDEYFMAIARVVASRSNCVKRKVAAVITRRPPHRSPPATTAPPAACATATKAAARAATPSPKAAPASTSACAATAKRTPSPRPPTTASPSAAATLYTTFCPCLICTKMIINSGIDEVVYNADYPMGDVSLSLLREAGVKVRQVALGEGAGR